MQRIRKSLRSEGHWEGEPSLETTVPTYSSGDVAMDLKLGQCQALLSRLKRHKVRYPQLAIALGYHAFACVAYALLCVPLLLLLSALCVWSCVVCVV